MIRETGADYKKAIVAVAIASGVGATVAGAGLLVYRLWRRSRSVSDIKSDRPSAPLHTATAVDTGESLEKPASIDQPTTSHEQAASVEKPATDVLSTSGTFEKVPSPAPESFEQLSMSQLHESPVTPSALPTSQQPAAATAAAAAAAASQLKTSTPSEPPAQTAAESPPAPASAESAESEPSSHVHMKEKNDIVMVETNSSSGSDDADASGKQSAVDSSNVSHSFATSLDAPPQTSESPATAEPTDTSPMSSSSS